MTAEELRDRAADLEAIRENIFMLLDCARNVLRGTSEQQRARSYWLAHIETALSTEHMYLGGSMVTMSDTIQTLREDADDLENDAEEVAEESLTSAA